jgi:hypothetical protein
MNDPDLVRLRSNLELRLMQASRARVTLAPGVVPRGEDPSFAPLFF